MNADHPSLFSPGNADSNQKTRFAAELQEDERVTSIFLVKQKDVKLKKSGDPYLSLVLGDRTGELDAKMWDNIEEVQDTFERDDFVKVRGIVVMFRNRPQLQVQKLRRMDEREIEMGDYLPSTRADVDQMYAEIVGYVEAFQNPHLKALLLAMLQDEEIAARYRRAPAAKSLHHAFFGGLLEHVCSLCRLARLVAQNYPGQVDLDLLLSGILLHDIGKIEELSYSRSFSYTTEGQLLGHMMIALEMVHRKLRDLPEFPRPLQVLLEHMIISHHGRYEYGSAKLPMFPEAILLHQLDDLDSRMQTMQGSFERDRTMEGEWTGYNAALERPLLKVDRWLNREAPGPAKAATTAEGQPVGSSKDTLEDKAAQLRAALRGEKERGEKEKKGQGTKF